MSLPVSSATLAMVGYFQMISWFCAKPWPEMSSLCSLDHRIEHTCNKQQGVRNWGNAVPFIGSISVQMALKKSWYFRNKLSPYSHKKWPMQPLWPWLTMRFCLHRLYWPQWKHTIIETIILKTLMVSQIVSWKYKFWVESLVHHLINYALQKSSAKPGAPPSPLWLTCDCVSTLCISWPVLQFQKRMFLSAVPPPLASRLGCHGHQASAYK